MRRLHLDLETCSEADLRKTGASRYSRDPSTRVTVIAWAFDDEPIKSVAGEITELPKEIADHLAAGGELCAYNAAFEAAIIRNVLKTPLKPEQISCVMQRALHAGLPAALGSCGPALGLDIVKDTTAHGLMLRMSRPRAPGRWWHLEDPEKLAALEAYCRQDVAAEREIDKNIPELPEEERRLSIIDRVANDHGIYLDIPLIHKMIAIADVATKELNAECMQLTSGAVSSAGTQTAKMLAWLGDYAPEDLSKAAVAEALKRDDLPDNVRRVLEIRQLVAKSSVKKLKAALACVDDDGAARGINVYYGANRTGRNSSTRIQAQNMPRPSIKMVNEAIDSMMRGASTKELDTFFGSPLEVIASCLRGFIIPRPGKVFVVSDLAQIEARVVAWLAGQKDVLEVFASGQDIYTYTANKMGSSDRQFGKVLVLACGFGMGPGKFADTAKTYGLELTPEQAEAAVAGWRDTNPRIRQLWWDLDRTVKEVIRTQRETKGRVTKGVNKLISVTVGPARNGSPLMTIRLPSGRKLFYRDIRLLPDPKDPTRENIVYSGVDQTTKRWGDVRSYGGKICENITQASARDVVFHMVEEIVKTGVGDLITTIHDEVVFEVDASRADEALATIERIMHTAPAWAEGCPVGAEAGVMTRYGKG